MGTSGLYRPTLFKGPGLPYLDHALVGQSAELADQVDALVKRMTNATAPGQIIHPLTVFAKNIDTAAHFPRMLREFVTTGSMNALQALRPQEIDILLRAWGVKPALSAQVANRARLLLPLRPADSVPASGKAAVPGSAEKQVYLWIADVDLLFARNSEQLAQVLKRVMEKAELTPTEMAKKTGISRSQVYYLIGSKSLPRKPEQLKAFLMACRLHPEQAKLVLEQWRQLDRRRGEPAPPNPVEEPTTIPVDVRATAAGPAEEAAKTIRVDGPNGRSITITGTHVDTDRGLLTKLLVMAAAYSSRSSRIVSALAMGLGLLTSLMGMIVAYFGVAAGGAGEPRTVAVANPLSWFPSTGEAVVMTVMVVIVMVSAIFVYRRARKRSGGRRALINESKLSETSASPGKSTSLRLVA